MGTSFNGAQFAKKLERLSRDLRDTQGPLNTTALAGKKIFAGTAAAANATRLARARYDIRGNQAIIRYAGRGAHLVNNDTKRHRIQPRRRRRIGATRWAIVINGNFRAYANHPGTRGKRFFEKARDACEVTLPRIYMREQVTEPLRRIF